MKNIKIHAFIFSLIISVILCCTACDSSDYSVPPNTSENQNTTISVKLTDAPGDYDAVNLEVIGVQIKSTDDGDDQNGWISIGAKRPVVYNLLTLTGGENALIADTLVAPGHLAQIRLLLGTNNTVLKNGVSYPLKIGQRSGLKLKLNETLAANTPYEFILDVDVDKSVSKDVNSSDYILNPVIRIFNSANLGAISGTINPIGFTVKATAMVGNEEVSAYVDKLGAFQINGVSAGNYVVIFTPDPKSGYLQTAVSNVIVVHGESTDLGTFILPLKK